MRCREARNPANRVYSIEMYLGRYAKHGLILERVDLRGEAPYKMLPIILFLGFRMPWFFRTVKKGNHEMNKIE